MGADLAPLRARLSETVRGTLPSDDRVESWIPVLGPALGELLVELDATQFGLAMDELGDLGQDAVPVLRAVEAAGNRAQQKRVRRVLHKLRSRGEEVGEASRSKSAAVLRPVEKLSERAFATFIDPVGERVVFLFVPLRGGTYVYEILVSDALGVLQARRLEGRRRDARRFERELRGQDRSFEVPAPAARVLIARAARSGSGGVAAGVDRALVTELLKGVDPEAPTPGELARERLQGRELSIETADGLLREQLLKGRLAVSPPTGELVDAARRELEQTGDGVLVLSGQQQQERRQRLLGQHAERIFVPDLRDHIAERLDETAWGLLEAGQPEAGLAATVTAARLRGDEPALSIALVGWFLEPALALDGPAEPKSTESGLILPGR